MNLKTSLFKKADKGNAVVITERTKYIEAVKSLLSDGSKILQVPIAEDKWINYIINLESRLEDCFKVLNKEEKISKKEFDGIFPVRTMPGILYSNARIQKTVVNNTSKFQPILSAINIPTYLLAKYLSPILSPLTPNELTVKISLDFAEEVVN